MLKPEYEKLNNKEKEKINLEQFINDMVKDKKYINSIYKEFLKKYDI